MQNGEAFYFMIKRIKCENRMKIHPPITFLFKQNSIAVIYYSIDKYIYKSLHTFALLDKTILFYINHLKDILPFVWVHL
jgi:hypothetical protein